MSTAAVARTKTEQAAQYRAEAEQAKGRLEFEYAFVLLDTAEALEREAAEETAKHL